MNLNCSGSLELSDRTKDSNAVKLSEDPSFQQTSFIVHTLQPMHALLKAGISYSLALMKSTTILCLQSFASLQFLHSMIT